MSREDDHLSMSFVKVCCGFAQGTVIWLVIELQAAPELLDRQRRPQKRSPVGSGPPHDSACGDVPGARMLGNRRHVDLIGTSVEVDHVSRDARNHQRRAMARGRLIELVDEDVRVAQDRERIGLDLGLDLRRHLQAGMRHLHQDRSRGRFWGDELDVRHGAGQALKDLRKGIWEGVTLVRTSPHASPR